MLGILVSGAVLASANGNASPGGPPPPALEEVLRPAHVAGEVLVKFKAGASPSAADSFRVQFGAHALARFRSGGERWRLGAGHTEAEAIATLKQSPLVEYAEPNYTLSIDRTPNDPRYGELYGLHNTGQTGGTPGADIDAERAWGISTGSPNVVVALIDTGVDYTHPDLAPNMWTNPGEIPGNGVDDDGNGYVDDVRGWDFYNHDNDPMDDHSHGTHTAGTIGAVGNNGIGVVGVAWTVKILPLKFLGADGSGSTSDAVLAIEYATAAHADVMSNSWGGGGFSQALLDAIREASDAGILFVAAAGNSSYDNDVYPNYPSNYDVPNVVAVAATDSNDNLAYFSNYGATTVDLGAPGVDTLSCLPGNSYGTKSGTSMATPHVSGVAALIRAVAPGIDLTHLKARLLAAVDPVPALAGRTVTGGRLNAFLAIADPDQIPPGSVSDLAVTESNSNSLVVGWTAPGDDGDSGTATRYDVRWSEQPIDGGNFASATPAPGAPTPAAAGRHETLEVTGLAPSRTYYVAMKALDEWGNESALSNVASGDTLPPPTFSYSPPSFNASLLTGGSATRALSLRNAGVGTLDWTIADPADAGYGWLSAAPRTGRLRAGEQTQVVLTANATGLDGGSYQGWLEISTNDPNSPHASLPFVLSVTGAPDLALVGAEIVVSSKKAYASDGAATDHALAVGGTPDGGGTLELTANGDYGDPTETATATAEGRAIGSVGGTGYDCSPADAVFQVAPGVLAALAADGVVNVRVQNSADVNTFCTEHSHEVILRYHRNADPTEFGSVYLGTSRQETVFIENRGTALLDVLAITMDRPEFRASESALSIPPHQSRALVLTFAPTLAGDVTAALTLRSDDPDTPVTTVTLTGAGVEPPAIVVTPASLRSTLNEGTEETQRITVSNTGGSPLAFNILATPPEFTGENAPSSSGAPERTASGEFQSLRASPVPLTCVVADDDGGFLYAQANQGYAFYRYDPQADTWGTLAASPLYSGNNGGAALLNGKIYTVYTENSQMGVYDISTDSWTVENSPLGSSTGNIASDGTRFLYLAVSSSFLRFDPAAGLTESLASPPFYFERWGALVWSRGHLYGHQGNGNTAFATFDPASGSWTSLPYIPGGAVLGAALDPFGGDYYAVGSYAGNTLYSYSIAQNRWTTRAIPYFSVDDGGLGWMTSPVPGILVVQGERGTGLARFATGASNVTVNPVHGTLAPGASATIDVHFDARTSPPGTYSGSLLVRSDDPVSPEVAVATTFTIVGSPEIHVAGERHAVLSTVAYSTYSATTTHDLDVGGEAGGPATLDLTADGDFGDSTETATAYAEGSFVGAVGGAGYDCTPATGSFPIAAADFARLAADGRVRVTVQNSSGVDPYCTVNRHAVRLSWNSPGDRFDFGRRFVGFHATKGFSIENLGSVSLHVTSITSDDSRFVPSAAAAVVPPHSSVTMALDFAPEAPGPASGTLTIASDDPDEGTVTVPLSGEGVIPPDIEATPDAFNESLVTGASVTRTLSIDNVGGSDLTWGTTATASDANAQTTGRSGAAAVGRALLVQDSPPWGRNANEAVLAANGIAYDVVSTSALFTTTLTDYALIIVSSEQGSSSYTNLQAQKSRIDAYVSGGGRLEFHGSSYYGYAGAFVLPGGTTTLARGSYTNDVRLPSHPLVAGVPSVINGSYASHSAFANVPASAQIVTTNDAGQPTLVEYRVGVGTVIASGQTLEFYYGADSPVGRILSNMIPYAWSRLPAWLRVAPASGTVPAGGHAELAVAIDAAGLFGGDYDGSVAIASNDPDEPLVSRPVHLHVTGAPDVAVEPPSIDFGAVFTGFPAARQLTLRNAGTDVLHVGTITTSDPAYTVGPAPSDIPIGGASTVTVTFAPGSSGRFDATLAIPTNDPDEGLVAVPLTGTALVPPDIGVAPAELHEAAPPNQVVTKTLTISNTGGSDLTWSLKLRNIALPAVAVSATVPSGAASTGSSATAPAGYAAAPSGPRTAAGSRVLLVQDSAPWGSNANERILQANGLAFDRANTQSLGTIELSAYDLVIIASDQPSGSYATIASFMARLSAFVASGGVLEFHAAGEGYNGGDSSIVTLPGGTRIQNWFASTNHVAAPTHPIMEGVPEPFTGSYASHVDFTNLPAGANVLATDDKASPSLIEYGYGGGWVIVSGQPVEFAYDHLFSGYRILSNMIPYAFASAPRWLSVTPSSGTTPAAGSDALTVAIDTTGLAPGDYAAKVVVVANDPDEPTTGIPITIHVIGTPDIDVSPSSLDFGTVFVGFPKSLVLHVTNAGTEPLTVSPAAPDDPSITVDTTTFTLARGASRDLTVTMSPAAARAIATNLVITSNDPDEATTVVPVSGHGLLAPDIDATPPSFAEALFTGAVVTRTLSIANSGGSDLTWSVATVATAAGAAAGAPGAATSGRALLVENSPPWGRYSNEQVLASSGIAYDVLPSWALSTTALTSYALVIVASEQSANFYTDLASQKSRIDAYVAGGGRLEFHASSYYGYASLFVLPGGTTNAPRTSYDNFVVLPSHPLVAGVPSVISGNYASHSALANVPANAQIVTTNDIGQPTLVEYRFGSGTVIASGHTLEFYYGTGVPVGTILANMIPYAWSRSPAWLRAEPTSGTVAAGGHVDVAVTIDATGLLGGDYDAALAVASNDPDEPTLTRPAHLHVIGVPDIAVTPSSLDFGSVFTGYATSRDLTIHNGGTDVLHVAPMTVDDAAYSAGSTPIDIPIGESRTVTVGFSPSTAGLHGATLTIASNDPDEATVTVSLTGVGLVPPDVDVSPTELHETTWAGHIVTRTLTLSNTGGSDLTFGVRVSRAAAAAIAQTVTPPQPRPDGDPASAPASAAPAAYEAIASSPRVAAGSSVLLVQDYAPWGSTANERILQANGFLFDRATSTELATINLSRYRLVIVSGDQTTTTYVHLASSMGRLAAYVAAGGVLDFHAAGNGWNGGDSTIVTLPDGLRIRSRLSGTNHVADGTHPVMQGVPDPFTGSYASHVYFTDLPPSAHVLATDDYDRSPTLLEYGHGAGWVIASGQPLEIAYDNVFPGYRILPNLIAYGYAPTPRWLDVSPEAGTVPPAGSMPLAVTFDPTGLEPGTYGSTVLVTSNDPDEPIVAVPVSLHVLGVPSIAVTPSSLDFGAVFTGYPRRLFLQLSNLGTEVLNVSSITSAEPSISVDAGSFAIGVGENRQVAVTFGPGTAGPLATTLDVVSDDPDHGTLRIPLAGSGLVPPNVVMDPADLDITVLHGESAVRTLTVRNTGGSDLTWSLDVGVRAASRPQPPADPGTVPGGSSVEPHAAFRPASIAPHVSAGARVLIIEDYAPWGSTANERVLAQSGLNYDVIDTHLLPSQNLAAYGLVIVASDQPSDTYLRLEGRIDQLTAYVAAGGVLEFHAAGWGWNAGDATSVVLPGGMTIVHHIAGTNHVAAPVHPLMTGVPEPIIGFAASHASFDHLPPGTTVIGTDDLLRANLVEYAYGSGRVIASGHTLEFSFDRGDAPGQILYNMIPWAAHLAASWLSFRTTAGVVPAGGSVDLEIEFDGSLIAPGDYASAVLLSSNDPDEPALTVAAKFHVLRLRADAGADQRLECTGGGGAEAVLDGRASAHMNGPGAITRFAWSEDDRAIGEGALVTASLPLGSHEVALRIEDATGAHGEDGTTVAVVDSVPPSGAITSPVSGACYGPSAIPVAVVDSFTDRCGAGMVRTYDPPGGASVSAHGDHLVTLRASDTSGNAGVPASVAFTIDTMPPSVTIVADPATFQLPQVVPFSSLFTSSDDDGASGGVVHEVVAVDGCVVYDGSTYGDRDGLLSDETVSSRDVTLCDMARACGRRHWTNPVIAVTATDCGGNATTASIVAPGDYLASECSPATTLSVASQAGTARLSWNPVQGASGYQVVRGDLGILRATGGQFHNAVNACLAQAAPAGPIDDPAKPSAGAGFWYLVRDVTEGVRGSWDEVSARQARSRDDGIDSSGAACP